MGERIVLGKWTEESINILISTASRMQDIGEQIQYISGRFLEIPYQESTLVGGPGTEEELVVDFSGVDCFTFLDYVEAMRRASSFETFFDRLKEIRYRAGEVTYQRRNHFFTDWREFNSRFVTDITRHIGDHRVRQSFKFLNQKSEGTFFLDHIPVCGRTVDYIPSESIDAEVLNSLNTGDYIGIYTPIDGLDVSHVGLLIKHDGGIYFRHASSAESCRKVTDRLFVNYVKEKPGIVVLRPQTLCFKIFHETI
ncbi:MAG: N-acetylmuramoyl-L-alanine amidase-like domain-containing protein [Syntrophorhabdaceae bacterium]